MTCIIEILQRIKMNPLIYIGCISLDSLKIFLDGYIVREIELNGIEDISDFFGFQKFVEEKFSSNSAIGWNKIISNQFHNENEAFEAFFNIIDEYISIMGTSERRINTSDDLTDRA